MIDLEKLDLEYNNYKNIRDLYIKYKNELEKFNKKYSKELNSLLIRYNSIKNMKINSSKQDTTADELLANLRVENPLFEEWYELDCNVKDYQNALQQYSSTTQAFMECSRFICLKHKNDDGYDLLDLSTHDKLDLSQYDDDKQQYILNDLKNHHSFICCATQEDLPLLMQIVKEVDKEIYYNDDDTEEVMEQKFWEEINRCYMIKKEFEKRKNSTLLKEINNIEYERKLIELLGYNLIGPNKSNRWVILDESNNEVGFIQYKKLFSKNDKKGYLATFGYCTKIDSQKVFYNSTRVVDKPNRFSMNIDDKFEYELDIKRENGDTDHLEISVGKYPKLILWSKSYGYMRFSLSDGLFLDFKSKTENFNIRENLVYKTNNNSFGYSLNQYDYQLSYCDKSIDIDNENSKSITSRLISGISPLYKQDRNEIKLVERTWINGKLRTDKENEVAGTIHEMAIKHQMGIDAFKHFRFLINQILPFKREVISAMLENYSCNAEELSLFVPELGEEKLEILNKLEKFNENMRKSKTNSEQRLFFVEEARKFRDYL